MVLSFGSAGKGSGSGAEGISAWEKGVSRLEIGAPVVGGYAATTKHDLARLAVGARVAGRGMDNATVAIGIRDGGLMFPFWLAGHFFPFCSSLSFHNGFNTVRKSFNAFSFRSG
jgi:hypothetical protein